MNTRGRFRASGLANTSAPAPQRPPAADAGEAGLYPLELGGGTYLEVPAIAGYQLERPAARRLAVADIVSFFSGPQKRERRPAFTGAHGIIAEAELPPDLIGGQNVRPYVSRRTLRRIPTAGWDYGLEVGGE